MSGLFSGGRLLIIGYVQDVAIRPWLLPSGNRQMTTRNGQNCRWQRFSVRQSTERNRLNWKYQGMDEPVISVSPAYNNSHHLHITHKSLHQNKRNNFFSLHPVFQPSIQLLTPTITPRTLHLWPNQEAPEWASTTEWAVKSAKVLSE